MRWGIIGAGLIGGKRADSLLSLGENVAAVADLDASRAGSLASKCGAKPHSDWKKICSDKNIDAVVVATTHDNLSRISVEALRGGKHVLVEKPAGRNPKEIAAIISAQKKTGLQVGVGFNHRFHPAIAEAKKTIQSGKLGPMLFMRARYGHGGRLGYEKEWRFNPEISGGGQLIDQGSHLIDLSRFFSAKEFAVRASMCSNHFWQAPAEDTAHLLLRSQDGVESVLSTNSAQWKNLFSFEIYLKHAQLSIDGLGKSYGEEKLTIYRMRPEMGPPDAEVKSYVGPDKSFEAETADFIGRIGGKPSIGATLDGALSSMEIISQAYKKNKAVK